MKFQTFNYILLKLASRCNLNCSYCYWFRDETVYAKPKILSVEVEDVFCTKLIAHITKYNLKKFSILFHGGEPLLFGKKRLLDLCNKLREIEDNTNCTIILSMTTNGVLIDNEFASILKFFNISVTISIDGTKEIHDKNRTYLNGKGSYDETINSINLLKKYELEFGVLAVCDPKSNPNYLYNHFIEDLKLKHFDVLIPDFTYEDNNIESISDYYIGLFNLWYGDGTTARSEIRILKSFILGLLGFNTTSEGLGYGPIQTLTMLTDGTLEPLDVLRISGNGKTKTNINIFNNEIQDVVNDEVWQKAYKASLNLNIECLECTYKNACGGGFLPHRWSDSKEFDNVSVYCKDLKVIYKHIWNKVSEKLYIQTETEKNIPIKNFC